MGWGYLRVLTRDRHFCYAKKPAPCTEVAWDWLLFRRVAGKKCLSSSVDGTFQGTGTFATQKSQPPALKLTELAAEVNDYRGRGYDPLRSAFQQSLAYAP